MAYTKNYDPWVNGNANAIDAAVLNNIETGIDEAHTAIDNFVGGLAWSNKVVGDTGTSLVANDGIFADTTGGAFNLVLPATPTMGDTVKVVDVAGNFATAGLTLDVAAGDKLMGVVDDGLVLSANYDFVEVVYSGAAHGWVITGKP